MNLRDKWPAIFAAFSICVATFLSYNASLIVNDALKGHGAELPYPTQIAIFLCRNHVVTVLSLLAIAGLVLIETRLQSESMKRHSQVILMGALLILFSVWFLVMTLPSLCLCDAWRQW